MAEDQQESVADQVPRRIEPAHRFDNQKRGGNVSRRWFMNTAAKLGAGFGIGAVTGTLNAEQGREPVYLTYEKPRLTGIKTENLAYQPAIKKMPFNEIVGLESYDDVPTLFTDPPMDLKMIGALGPEQSSQSSPDRPQQYIVGGNVEGEEDSVVYYVGLPKGESVGVVNLKLRPEDTVYVIPHNQGEMNCSIGKAENIAEDDMYQLTVAGDDPFKGSSSLYVIINTKPGTLV